MDDNCVFIIDEGILNEFSLLDSDGEDYYRGENACLFFEYLSYRKYNKKAYMIPSLFKKISENLKTAEKQESLAYFKNWVEYGDIGESPDTTEEQDILSLYRTLSCLHEKVFIVSNKYDTNISFKEVAVLNIEKVLKYIKDKKDFMNYIRLTYYEGTY